MDEASLQQAQVWIAGQVQGVGYRAATRRQAVALGITGWVRNLPDGCVEAWFEGETLALQAMIDWCWQGPPAGRVTQVEVTYGSATGVKGFVIRYD